MRPEKLRERLITIEGDLLNTSKEIQRLKVLLSAEPNSLLQSQLEHLTIQHNNLRIEEKKILGMLENSLQVEYMQFVAESLAGKVEAPEITSPASGLFKHPPLSAADNLVLYRGDDDVGELGEFNPADFTP